VETKDSWKSVGPSPKEYSDCVRIIPRSIIMGDAGGRIGCRSVRNDHTFCRGEQRIRRKEDYRISSD
jgi:hypothetical protein